MKLFVLTVWGLFDELILDETNPPLFPLEMSELNCSLGFGNYYSSREKALAAYKEVFSELDEEDRQRIVWVELEEVDVDRQYWVQTENYNAKGDLVLVNKNEESLSKGMNPKYQKNEFVLFTYNRSLCVGKILEVPYTEAEMKAKQLKLEENENVYYISFFDPHNRKDEFPHSHSLEGYILKSIQEGELPKYLNKEAIQYLSRQGN